MTQDPRQNGRSRISSAIGGSESAEWGVAMNGAEPQQPQADQHVFLIGRPSMGEAAVRALFAALTTVLDRRQ